jgi:hypothetical protein
MDASTSYKNIDLKSEGHVAVCEALEASRTLFCFEVNTQISDDSKDKSYRRLDLLIIGNLSVLNVEIDGTQHNENENRSDDYLRDRLLSRSIRTIRFTHAFANSHPQQVVDIIHSELDKDLFSTLKSVANLANKDDKNFERVDSLSKACMQLQAQVDQASKSKDAMQDEYIKFVRALKDQISTEQQKE